MGVRDGNKEGSSSGDCVDSSPAAAALSSVAHSARLWCACTSGVSRLTLCFSCGAWHLHLALLIGPFIGICRGTRRCGVILIGRDCRLDACAGFFGCLVECSVKSVTCVMRNALL